eukprot:g5572.t1
MMEAWRRTIEQQLEAQRAQIQELRSELDASKIATASHQDKIDAQQDELDSMRPIMADLLKEKVAASDDEGRKMLLDAAQEGKLALVRGLLEAGVDKDLADEEGYTSLHYAALYGHGKVAEFLLKAGADKEKVPSFGDTPLHCAAREGHGEVAALLLKFGADKNKVNSDMETPLVVAARGERDTIMELLLKAGADIEKTNGNGDTPLIVAAENGHEKAVTLLLAAGADKDKVASIGGFTALAVAAQYGRVKVVEALSKAGADKNKVDNDGYSPLHHAASGGYPKVIAILMKGGAEVDGRLETELGYTPLIIAVITDDEAKVAQLLEAGADTGTETTHGDLFALCVAAKLGNIKMVAKLLDAGADKNQAESHGLTALHAAAREGHTEVVAKLIAVGADMEKGDADTPAISAASYGNRETLLLLLKAGARPTYRSPNLTTVLHAAVRTGRIDMVKDIVNIYPNPDAWYTLLTGGYTARKAATTLPPAQRSFLEKLYDDDEKVVLKLVRSFLYKPRYQRDLNAKENYGWTPLRLAEMRGFTDIVKLLKRNGAGAAPVPALPPPQQ